jgi:hypothetical protein
LRFNEIVEFVLAQQLIQASIGFNPSMEGNEYDSATMATCGTNADRFGHSCVSSACGPCHAPAMETGHPENMG